MSFRLVFGDFEHTLPLNFEQHAEDLLLAVVSKAEEGSTEQAELSRRIVDTITALVEGNVIPPTRKQIEYALAICRELSLELPAEVIQFRDSMTTFLGTHAATYRRKKGSFAADR